MAGVMDLLGSKPRRERTGGSLDVDDVLSSIEETEPVPGGGTPYGLAALDGECQRMREAPDGTRNDTLNRVSYRIFTLIAQGEVDASTAVEQVAEAARAAGLSDGEIDGTLKSGAAAGFADGREAIELGEPLRKDPVALLNPSRAQALGVTAQAAQPEEPEYDEDDLSDYEADFAGVIMTAPDAPSAESPSDAPQFVAAVAVTDPQADHDAAVKERLERLLIDDEARALKSRLASAGWTPPAVASLSEALKRPRRETKYLVDGMWPAGANITVAATYKSGKTTLVIDLIRSLVNHERFGGTQGVARLEGKVCYLNFEMVSDALTEWFRSVGIKDPNQVVQVDIRDSPSPFNIADEATQEWLVGMLKEVGAQVLVIDTYSAAAAAALESENDNVATRGFLALLDQIKARSGVTELLLITHTGRESADGKVRTRGATAIDDWTDVRWMYRVDPDDSAKRLLSAFGRDVDFEERAVGFDKETRHVSLSADAAWVEKRSELERAVLGIVTNTEGQSTLSVETSVRDGLGIPVRKGDVAKVLASLEVRHEVRHETRRGSNGKFWYPATSDSPADEEPVGETSVPYYYGISDEEQRELVERDRRDAEAASDRDDSTDLDPGAHCMAGPSEARAW